MIMKQRAFFLTLGLLALGGMSLILYATPEGLALYDDSIAYIAGARSILSGNGYREAWLASNQPVTHFPPVFPITLAFIGISGMDPLRAVWFLNAFLFGANIFLCGVIGWRMTQSQLAGAALALLVFVNASLFNAHADAMSEPLYIFFTLAAFLTFDFGCKTSNAKWLAAAGVLTSLAYLTRYAGLALLATFFAAVILLQDGWRQRLKNAGIFLAGFLPLAFAWSIRNKLLADNATNRAFVYHPLSEEHISSFIYNISEFLIPVESLRRAMVKDGTSLFILVGVIAFALLVWVFAKGLKKFFQPSSPMPETLSFLNGLYIFGYLASILSSMLFFDASTKFKLRILAPVYVALLILLVNFFVWLWGKRHTFWRGLALFVFLLLFSLSAAETFTLARALNIGRGQGYASFKWYDSKAMDFISKLPEGARIYTNQAPAVYLYTNRPAYVLPDLIDPVTLLPRGNFDEGARNLQNDVLSGNAVLALFDVDSQSEETRQIYEQLSKGLYLALQTQGDRIYTAQP